MVIDFLTTSLKPCNCIPNGLATRFHDNTVASISRVPYSQKKNGTRTCDTMKRFLFFNAKTGSFFRKTSCNNNRVFLTGLSKFVKTLLNLISILASPCEKWKTKQYFVSSISDKSYYNVTLDDEFHGKYFTSHKQEFSDQFGTKIEIVTLS